MPPCVSRYPSPAKNPPITENGMYRASVPSFTAPTMNINAPTIKVVARIAATNVIAIVSGGASCMVTTITPAIAAKIGAWPARGAAMTALWPLKSGITKPQKAVENRNKPTPIDIEPDSDPANTRLAMDSAAATFKIAITVPVAKFRKIDWGLKIARMPDFVVFCDELADEFVDKSWVFLGPMHMGIAIGIGE